LHLIGNIMTSTKIYQEKNNFGIS